MLCNHGNTCMYIHCTHTFSPSTISSFVFSYISSLFSSSLPYTHHTLTDEEKVLEEVIRDTEQLTLEEEEEEVDPIEEKGEEEKAGGGQGAEPGSPAALLDEFISRSRVYCCYGNHNCCHGNITYHGNHCHGNHYGACLCYYGN